MTLTVIITKDNQPRSFRWGIRAGVNQPNELGLSRAEANPAKARRAAERVFGPLEWIDAAEAGADERNSYVVECAKVDAGAAAPLCPNCKLPLAYFAGPEKGERGMVCQTPGCNDKNEYAVG